MKKSQFLIIILIAISSCLSAQTNIWNGGSTDWHTPANWSQGIPTPAHDVDIPNTGMDPVITTAASAKSVTIDAMAELTVNSSLTISGATTHGMNISGNLNVGTAGEIYVDNTTERGIDVTSDGSILNDGDIIIGSSGSIGAQGIVNSGTITNNPSALIQIDDTGGAGINNLLAGSVITNDGNIEIGNTLAIMGFGILNIGTLTNNKTIQINNTGNNGIRNFGTITNNAAALIQIDNTSSTGIFNSTDDIITNSGEIKIGEKGGADNIGDHGIYNFGTITNNAAALIQIDNTSSTGIFNSTDDIITNSGEIKIGENGKIGTTGMINAGAFVNNGDLFIENVVSYGIDSYSSITNNEDGLIQIDNANAGIINRSTGVVTNDGTIDIEDINNLSGFAGEGIFNGNIVTNNGLINIGTISSIASLGISNSGNANFINTNTLTIGGPSGSIGADGIDNNTDATFHNYPCATINLYDNLNNTSSVDMINDGYIYANTPQTHTPGAFVNNGAISDPPGTFPTDMVDAPDFVNNEIVVTSTQVGYCPSAISPALDITNLTDYSITGVYTTPSGMMSAGMYSTSTNTFTPNSPIPNNTTVLFYVKLEKMGVSCPIYAEWPVVVAYNDVLTFTGGGNSADWNDPNNWDQMIIPTICHNVIIPAPTASTVNPIIQVGTTATAKSVTIQAMAELTVEATLTISGATAHGMNISGILNVATAGIVYIDNTASRGINITSDGSILNDGDIKIGSTGTIGSQGIVNSGTINNNNPSALIQIDDTGGAGINNLLAGSVITNDGNIEIGNTLAIMGFGIFNTGTLTNNKTIQINNTGNIGIINFGALTNSGDLFIDNVFSYGIDSNGSITNNVNGLIQINNANAGIINRTDGVLTNDGTILIEDINGFAGFAGQGISNEGGSITNNGHINIGTISSIASSGFLNGSSANFINTNTLTIGGPAGSIGLDGIINFGTLTNNATALIQIDNTDRYGIFNSIDDIIINSGEIKIGENGNIGDFGVSNRGTITNNATALIQIDNTSSSGIFNSTDDIIINSGEIKIGENGNIGSDGIENLGTINNNSCASIYLHDNLNNLNNFNNTNIITNDGYLYLNTAEIHVPGNFDNNGIIADPLGTFPTDMVDAPDFTNSNIVIASTISNACPTEIKPAFNRASSINYAVEGIYSDAAATMSAGIYTALSNTFVPTATLSHNTSYTYYVKLEDSFNNCEVIVEWNVTIGDDTITFTGLGDGIDWHDPLNWDLEVVPDICHHVIIPAMMTVEIYFGFEGLGRTLDVQLSGKLETMPGGAMDIQN